MMVAFLRNVIRGHEPVLVALLVRLVLYAIGAVFGVTIEPEVEHALLVLLASVAGVDVATSAVARAKVTPVGKSVDDAVEDGDLPASRRW